jgi:MoaA/NifB/PqqE/SkfB family radical SAM enzyme
MNSAQIAYTAAGVLPLKLLRNEPLMDGLRAGRIAPVHVQFMPTNRCNLNCSFCSCAKRDRGLEMTADDADSLAASLKRLGTQSVTITGGGEPLMHPRINDIVDSFYRSAIEVGLVTNGLLLGRLSPYALNSLTWCRISATDERPFDAGPLDGAVETGELVDWAFSYVAGRNFNGPNLCRYVEYANSHEFTHVRVVTDLIDLDNSVDMDAVRDCLREAGVDDSRVIYQGRKQYDPGMKRCLISLLKPVIGPDGFITPCCGAQYSSEKMDLDCPESMRMGHVRDIEAIYRDQKCFNGKRCVRCYYGSYNEMLDYLLAAPPAHASFV